MKKIHPYLIFDFDGTLVDSFRTAINMFNVLAKDYHFRKIQDEEIEGLRDLSSKELIKHFNIPLYKIPSVLDWARKQMSSKIEGLSSFPDLPETLGLLAERGISLGIVTSNSFENVISWLNLNQIQHLFNFVHAESNYFGKKYTLRKILKNHGLDQSNTFYIGDETRDVEAAKACDLYSVAVTWGYNSEYILSQHEPDYIVHKPQEILTLCSL